MLAKGRPVNQPELTPAEAWKRKRELSPLKHQPPNKKHSPGKLEMRGIAIYDVSPLIVANSLGLVRSNFTHLLYGPHLQV